MAGEVAAHAADVAANGGIDLMQVVAFLGAGVIAVPLFRRLGLGSVLGYLAAGLVIGPFGLKLVADPQAVLHAAELGVVLFLFIVGLEMEPAKLWGLRKQIFGLGVMQVALCGLVLTLAGIFVLGLAPPVAVQVPRFRLLVSPVVPALEAQVGAVVVPCVTAILTVIDEPLLKTAFEPPPSPMMLNSDCFQAVARPQTLSAPVVL